jgi:hypothetical protein
MKVIWPQAIGVEIERKFSFLLLEQTGELEIVIVGPVGPEYLSTIIPASDFVISPSSDFDPRFPWMVVRRLQFEQLKCQQSQA